MGVNKVYKPEMYAVTGETWPATGASTFAITLAAGATNVMTVTVTAKDARGQTVAAVTPFEIWISEAATGIGLTADSYSGNVTATVGAFHTALTAKKHFLGVTAATGILTFTVTDTAEPADQYIVAKSPDGRGVIVSAASGTNWG